jgi:hypothetical protein
MMHQTPLNDDFYTHIEGTTTEATGEAPSPEFERLNAALKKARIDLKEELQPPPVCWQMVVGANTYDVGTYGNFSLVTGKAKSRKSFFATIATATALGDGLTLGTYRSFTPPKSNVLYFDTEQGKYHVQKAAKRVCALVGKEYPENLHVFYLRAHTPSERREIIQHAIYTTPNPAFVVIDGVRDLVTSINSEEEATAIATDLMRWTEETGAHILCVLHQNKGDNNARGHVGTELVNKAETVLSVEAQNELQVSLVNATYSRDLAPVEFVFQIDANGLPQAVTNYEALLDQTKKKNPNKESFSRWGADVLTVILKECFKDAETLRYSALWPKLQAATEKHLQNSIGTNKAKELLQYYHHAISWIKQDAEKEPYYLNHEAINGASLMV